MIHTFERVRAFSWPQGSRAAEIISILSGFVLFLTLGLALSWSPAFVALGALAFGVTTWLVHSLTRAIACVFAAVGITAAVIGGLVLLDDSLLASLHVTWGWFSYAWWGVVVLVGLLARRSGLDRDFGLAELVGAWVGILTSISVWHKVDYSTSLLRLLVNLEDNEAWVALLTQIRSVDAIGPGFAEHFDGRGPVIATILGLLGAFQGSQIPMYNAAFSVWAMAVLLTPLVATGLLRRCGVRSALPLALFAGVLIAWAYRVPFLLFLSYGHLTATWAFLFLLVAAAMLSFDSQRAGMIPMLSGLVFAMGTVWYPIFPLGVLGLLFIGWRCWRADRGWARIGGLAFAGLMLVSLVALMAQAVGIVGAPPGVSLGVSNLYAAQGGTATFDGTLQFLVPIAVVLIALVPMSLRPVMVDNLWRLMVVCVGYVGAVFAGAYLVKVGVGYGPTKVWFILGFAVVVGLVSLAPRFRMQPRGVVAVALALLMGSLFYGGTGDLLSRAWPGGGTDPVWLPAIQAVAKADGGTPRPVACFSNDKYVGYLCTRWGAGLTTGEDFPFQDYRLHVAGELDPSEEINRLVSDGTLAKSDVIVMDMPDEGHAWGWTLIKSAGRVYGADGSLLEPRPTPPAGS